MGKGERDKQAYLKFHVYKKTTEHFNTEKYGEGYWIKRVGSVLTKRVVSVTKPAYKN
ncbi:hypothetical protein SAMN05444008_104259 [Cnuella takakiae]|uniref:Uncharacterized protein n=1 Tax=Cnuella takakiae TaxID=1302690 RepID=A0A1M4YF26_9BACT|nr:hypothetical protein SAMN05444008_104259 [Cnuella takakiae]